MKILIIDNYDSFTFNLYQLCGEIINKNSYKTNNNILVKRNDELTINDIKKIKPDKIIISPGPGSPEQKKYFGICNNLSTTVLFVTFFDLTKFFVVALRLLFV